MPSDETSTSNGRQSDVAAIKIPKALLLIHTAIMGILIPTALAVAGWLYSIDNKLTVVAEQIKDVAKNENRIDVLRQRLSDHVSDPRLHHAALTELRTRIELVERRLDKIESP